MRGVHIIIIPGHGTIIACTFPLLPTSYTRTCVRDLDLIYHVYDLYSILLNIVLRNLERSTSVASR